MRKNLLLILLFLIGKFAVGQVLNDSEILELRERLTIKFKGDAQIEVGGPYVGLEFHHASSLLQRISFYYPAANSIDNSTDYWYRDTTHILNIKLKRNNGKYEEIGNEIWEYNLTPYRVSFIKKDSLKKIEITYEFCKNSPAFLIKYSFKNTSDSTATYQLETCLTTSLRTCHTYNTLHADSIQIFNNDLSYRYSFNNIGNKFAQLFILNAGEKPFNKKGKSKEAELEKAIFNYEKTLKPGESFTVKQIIGCTTSGEFEAVTKNLAVNYESEVKEYESEVLSESYKSSLLSTGNKNLDFTTEWAKAVISSNRHYIDNDLVPMPCPAEYNFFFTHDVLVTDLAVVLYDLKRVRSDLLFLAKHKNSENVLPHAFYWKDSSYVTEFSEKDSWNHLWFLVLCGKYLRHSGDVQLLNLLYPIINKSIEITLNNKQPDDLMWAVRPDGWDIGTSYGPRTFMTVMAIQAFKEFIYISNGLQKNSAKLNFYEQLTKSMNEQLVNKLWSNELNYLINYYEDESQDKHYYIGSLLAAHFRFLDSDNITKLMNSARQNLLDSNLGIYNVYPMDFHLLKDFLKFQGNEVGPPFYYANGGVWQHGNAWYALGLISNGQNEEAYSFIKSIMTMNGVINSPNGQPAMYEYRISDKSNPAVYGMIDKPQFLWAGGWYQYTLYNLFGLRENEWNISFSPFILKEMDSIQLSVTVKGVPVIVDIRGEGSTLSSILFDGREIPSAIVPQDMNHLSKINLKLGIAEAPYLNSANTLVFSPMYDRETKTLEFDLESFVGHIIELQILSPIANQNISINGNYINSGITELKKNNMYEINLQHIAGLKRNHYSIKFK